MSGSKYDSVSMTALVFVITLAFGIVALAGAKILADGARSHTVSAHVRVARYKWLIGNSGAATRELLALGPTVIEAGLRWQVAEFQFLMAAGERALYRPGRGMAGCHAALETLAYGRYDRAGDGTSTTASLCRLP